MRQICAFVQIGYCGLDKQSLGAGPDAGSLDVEDYCKGYVSWDFLMIFLQVCPPRMFPCYAFSKCFVSKSFFELLCPSQTFTPKWLPQPGTHFHLKRASLQLFLLTLHYLA